MIAALQQLQLDLSDPATQRAIQQLKMLELQIPINEQQQLVQEIFVTKPQEQLQSSKSQIQIGQTLQINPYEEQHNKQLLYEYLDAQCDELRDQLDTQINDLKQLQTRFNQQQPDKQLQQFKDQSAALQADEENLGQNKRILNIFNENIQKSIWQLEQSGNSEFEEVQSEPNLNDEEFKRFIKEQKNLVTYNKQVNSLKERYMQNRRQLFDMIEEANSISQAVIQKQQMNIDNELKLVEKSNYLKVFSKIEQDLEQELLQIQKAEINDIGLDSTNIVNYGQDKQQQQINDVIKNIHQDFKDIKQTKINTNDYIFDNVCEQFDKQEVQINKLRQAQEQNTHNLIEYLFKYPNTQQYLHALALPLIQQSTTDYLTSQKLNKISQIQETEMNIDEFLKSLGEISKKQLNQKQEQSKFEQEWQQAHNDLQTISQFLAQLKQLK